MQYLRHTKLLFKWNYTLIVFLLTKLDTCIFTYEICTLNFPSLQVRLNHSIMILPSSLIPFLGFSCSFPMTPKSLPPSKIYSLTSRSVYPVPTEHFLAVVLQVSETPHTQSKHTIFLPNLLSSSMSTKGTTTHPTQLPKWKSGHRSRLILPPHFHSPLPHSAQSDSL